MIIRKRDCPEPNILCRADCDRSKESVTKLSLLSRRWNMSQETRVPQARKSLAQHVAEGGVLGSVGKLIRVPCRGPQAALLLRRLGWRRDDTIS